MLAVTVLCVLACAVSARAGENDKFSVRFFWKYINFTWPSYDKQLEFGYKPGQDIIAGIKIYGDTIYLALPRVREDSRVTLASLSVDADRENPLLSPYPSWELNSGGGCDSFQDVLSMEIDKDGVMWVLDGRRLNKFVSCPAKIVLLDLNRGGEVVKRFAVPDELCDHNEGCFLNDIVVDGDFAYVSDTTKTDPGIFVYDRAANRAWKIRDKTTYGDEEAAHFAAQGVEFTSGPSHINGIALSPDCGDRPRRFYYMAQTSYAIHSIETDVLKNESSAATDVSKFVTNHGTKQAQSGGMMGDDEGNLYYGLLPLDAVGKWNTTLPLEDAGIVDQNHEIIKWPDSFAFDGKGNLHLITNSILRFSKVGVDVKEVNFRILVLPTNSRSYQYCAYKEKIKST